MLWSSFRAERVQKHRIRSSIHRELFIASSDVLFFVSTFRSVLILLLLGDTCVVLIVLSSFSYIDWISVVVIGEKHKNSRFQSVLVLCFVYYSVLLEFYC